MKYTKKNMKKTYRLIFTIAIFIIAVFSSFYISKQEERSSLDVDYLKEEKNDELIKNNDEELKIHYIDVGQADSILIEKNGHYMLIDGGDTKCKDNLLNYLKNIGVEKFDYIIGTHVHEDHIGSLDDVILNFDCDKVLFPKQVSSTKTFENFVNAVKSKNLKLTVPVVRKYI